MSNESTAVAAVWGTVSAIIGFWFARWLQLSETRGRALARLTALRAEIHECGKRAVGIAGEKAGDKDQEMSRGVYFTLPDWVGREAIGSLTTDGLISEADAAVLVEHYSLVADVNRNLDWAIANMTAGQTSGPAFTNARIKAGHIVHIEDKPESLYTRVEAVVSRNINVVAAWRWYQLLIVWRRHS